MPLKDSKICFISVWLKRFSDLLVVGLINEVNASFC